MTVDELLQLISVGLKKPLTQNDILSNEIHINHLKRIDKVFGKGIHYYLDPKSPKVTQDASIFFRKSQFGSDLNIGAKKIVHQFEEFKISLSAISKLAEINIERTLPVFTVKDDPKIVANKIRKFLYPEFNSAPKKFLKSLIYRLAQYNILVFEFVETWNKTEKANIDGFFLKPNVIVLKRQQSSFRREIFTLVHELGHYLINEEEVEELDVSNLANNTLSSIEKWCNDFAYYFLAGEFADSLDVIEKADYRNDYHHDLVKSISGNTHLSKIALFTRILYLNKIYKKDYDVIKKGFDEEYRLRQEEYAKQKELDKLHCALRRRKALRLYGGVPTRAISSIARQTSIIRSWVAYWPCWAWSLRRTMGKVSRM